MGRGFAFTLLAVAFGLALSAAALTTLAADRGGFTEDSAAAMGLEATGLTVSFPTGADCPPIASPYASTTRYDGSDRPSFRMAGLHGGMDISLDTGTSLLAIADGVVVALDEGGQATGNYVWLRFPPEATGLGHHLYAKYQHLDELPKLKRGDRVKAGEQFAVSGDSGTVGRAFEFGYAHLHLTMYASPRGDVTKRFGPALREHGRMIDPLAIYLDKVQFARIYARTTALDGTTVTPSVLRGETRIDKAAPPRYWPVACK
jgi:murein DD-endopeptidase MepM/ murein hydrolase activator NlpD